MSTPPPTQAPAFTGRIPVSQMGAGGGLVDLVGPLACGFVLAAPFFAGFVWTIDDNAKGWRFAALIVAGLLMVLLGTVALMAGFVAWMRIAPWWRRKRGLPEEFSRTTKVEIGSRGLRVNGLGQIHWRDVLATEGVPDSDSYLIVHTRLFGRLLLQAPLDALRPVFAHHMAQPPATRSETLSVRAIVFHWPRFRAWIWLGYALAGAVAVALLLHSPDAGLFKTLVGLCVTPFIAHFVWWIPFDQLSTFSAKRVRAFVLEGSVLRSTDGGWSVDLRQRPAVHRRACGFGYDIEFLTLRPREGGRFDLVLDTDATHSELVHTLDSLKLLTGRG